ncbi:MAG: hypothetical protein AAF614_13775 [Chloroflexota bacterium]
MFHTLFQSRKQTRTIRAEGIKFNYREIHVAQAAEEPPILLIGLHGHGSNEVQMETLVNLEPKRPFTYISLRGYLSLDGGYTWLRLSFSEGGVVVDEGDLQQAVAKTAVFIQAMQQQYNIPANKTFIIGYSLGAGLGLALDIGLSRVGGRNGRFNRPTSYHSQSPGPTRLAP